MRYFIVLMLVVSAAAKAEPLVVEERTIGPQTEASRTVQPVIPVTPSAATSSVVSAASGAPQASADFQMYQQLQRFQQEISELRGQLEEQAHAIAQMKQEQRERYLDLDGRISALGDNSTSVAPQTEVDVSSAKTVQPSEESMYQDALSAIKKRAFPDALNALQEQLKTYPKGAFAANANYWLGEVYLALPDPQLNKAGQAFETVVTEFPNSAKVSDALFKLAKLSDAAGDTAKAKQYLNRIQNEFPNNPIAERAKIYLQQLP